MRVLLIGGTSNVGKSTLAQAVVERLGFEHRSTDYLARHPGRPWRTAEREVLPHVAEHYATAHGRRIDHVRPHALRAALAAPGTATVWLTADNTVLSAEVEQLDLPASTRTANPSQNSPT